MLIDLHSYIPANLLIADKGVKIFPSLLHNFFLYLQHFGRALRRVKLPAPTCLKNRHYEKAAARSCCCYFKNLL
jgi:hypothetical protein